MSRRVQRWVLAVSVLLVPAGAGAESLRGQLACGPYRIDRPSAESGRFTAELCTPKVRVEGTYSGDQLQPERVRVEGLARPLDLRGARLRPFNARSTAELERFLAPFEAIRVAETLMRPPAGETGDSAGNLIADAAEVMVGGGDVACTDVENATGSVIDIESAIHASTYVVPPWCLVIVMGPVDVDSLRVEGALIRVGGGIEADELRVGSLSGGQLAGFVAAYGVDVARATGSRAVADGAALLGDLAPGPGLLKGNLVHLSSGAVSVQQAQLATAIVSEKGRFSASGEVRAPVVRAQQGGTISAGSFAVDRVEAHGGAVRATGALVGRELARPVVVELRGGSVRGGSVTAADITLQGGSLEVTGPLSVPTLTARSGDVTAQDAEIDQLQLHDRSQLTARGYLGPARAQAGQAGAATVTDSSLTGGTVRYARIQVDRGSASATSLFDVQELLGTEAQISAGEQLRARTGPGRVELDRGSVKVAGTPVTGTPGFDACAAHPPQIDVTRLETRSAPVDATHVRADTLRIEDGHLWTSEATPSVQCVEVLTESHLDGTSAEPFMRAPRIYAALGRAVITGDSVLELTPAGDGPMARWVKTPSGGTDDASGASFGGFGGTSGSLNSNVFVPAEQPGARPELGAVDSPVAFRETGLGGLGKLGGAGGGVLRVRATTLTFDGRAHANGTDAKKAAGGGSGGTIIFEVAENLSGAGVLQVNGGKGAYGYPSLGGGGGSGGRIKIGARTRTGWRGRTETFGGLGSELANATAEERHVAAWDDWRNHGGPGTVYWELSDGPDELVIEGPRDGDAHRGVGFLNGNFPDAVVRIRNAVVVTDGLNARSLVLDEHGVLRPNNPRVRLDFPARHARHPFKPKDGKIALASSQVIYPATVWEDDFNEKLTLELSSDLTVSRTGRLDVSALGGVFQEGEAFQSMNAAGGSHAGVGGIGRVGNPNSFGKPALPYGNPLEPTDVGGGGFGWGAHTHRQIRTTGLGGVGGGALRLVVGGTAHIDGAVRADGDRGATQASTYHPQASGGGAGGSLWLSAAKLTGAGVISASGGDGTLHAAQDIYGGGGGGGRMRLDLAQAPKGWRGQVLALGGKGADLSAAEARRLSEAPEKRKFTAWKDLRLDAGAGTVLWRIAGERDRLEVTGGGERSGFTVLDGSYPEQQVRISNARVVSSRLEAHAVALTRGAVLTANDQRAWLHPDGRAPEHWLNLPLWNPPSEARLEVALTADLQIDRTSRIDVSGLGEYGRDYLSCNGQNQNRAGGSHAARGGAGGEGKYRGCPLDGVGDGAQPTTVGPGGFGTDSVDGRNWFQPCKAGGSGGGALKLTAARITLDGQLRADGVSGGDARVCKEVLGGGGGAGGSIWVTAQELAGKGTLSAAGAAGVIDDQPPFLAKGGGGSGGRIHVEAKRCAPQASVRGGGPKDFPGEPGTVLGSCRDATPRSKPRVAGGGAP